MAMFSRRSLQRMLDHLSAHLPIDGRRKLAHELDRQSSSVLGFEWETALLFSFSHVGKIDYEMHSQGGARPDITFVEAAENPVCFTSDVATVSDDGLEAENPVMRLEKELRRLRQKYNLSGNSIYFDIKGEATGRHFRDRKMRLKLPKGSDIDKLLAKHVAPIFERVQREGLPTATIEINEPGVELTINYDVNRRYAGGRYPSFTAAYSLKRNPVYRSLKAKAQKLKKSAGVHPLGIFLCDGGCALLNNTLSAVETVNVDQVINELFRLNSSVSFVAILTFPPTRSEIFVGIVKELRITCRVYVNPRSKKSVNGSALLGVINRALAYLPVPTATPRDALWWLANADANDGMTINSISYGGGLMSQSLKISARKIQEMLAGKVDATQFFNGYAQPNSPFENPFLTALKRGLTIEAISLTRVPDADDDLLEFRFGPADPAIRKFAVPKK